MSRPTPFALTPLSASASAMASCTASTVPEPMPKCVVCAASPASTRLPARQVSLRISLNRCHDAGPSSGSPDRTSAKISAATSRPPSADSPSPSHVDGAHSTMNVLVAPEDG